MALRDLQSALGQLVEARAAGRPAPLDALASLDLTAAERAWLASLDATRGFALTALVPRWWRETRIRRSARLTFAALGAAGPALLRDYQVAVPNFTLFFVPETARFFDFLETRPAPPHAHAVARFERAMWNARLTTLPPSPPGADAEILRHPDAAIVSFTAPPEDLFAALLGGTPLPDESSELHHALVSPGLPDLWRAATDDEARALASEPTRRDAARARSAGA